MSWYEPFLWVLLVVLAFNAWWFWRTVRSQRAQLTETQQWVDVWRKEAEAAQSSVWDLHEECQELRRKHSQLQQLYAERTQVALWAGVARFLMN